MVESCSHKAVVSGSSPIRHQKKGKGKSVQLPVKLTKRSPKPFLNTHIAQFG